MTEVARSASPLPSQASAARHARRGLGEVFNAGSTERVSGLIHRDPFTERITQRAAEVRLLRRPWRAGGAVKGVGDIWVIAVGAGEKVVPV